VPKKERRIKRIIIRNGAKTISIPNFVDRNEHANHYTTSMVVPGRRLEDVILCPSRTKYQLLAQSRWFSLGTLASSTTKTGRHDIAEILLKVALNTKIQNVLSNHHFTILN
jgi:hypothetical protein